MCFTHVRREGVQTKYEIYVKQEIRSKKISDYFINFFYLKYDTLRKIIKTTFFFQRDHYGSAHHQCAYY